MAYPILVLADDAQTREPLASSLRRADYIVLALTDAALAEEIVRDNPLGLVVLDLFPLRTPIFHFYWKLRAEPATMSLPTLVLLDQADDIARVESYGLRATDYLLKPIREQELLACTRTLLDHDPHNKQRSLAQPARKIAVRPHIQKHMDTRTEAERVLVAGDLRVDLATHRITFRHRCAELKSALLFHLLVYLARHRGVVLSCEDLLTHVWGYDSASIEHVGTRTVYVHMHWLRELLGDTGPHSQVIQTIRGVGYCFQG